MLFSNCLNEIYVLNTHIFFSVQYYLSFFSAFFFFVFFFLSPYVVKLIVTSKNFKTKTKKLNFILFLFLTVSNVSLFKQNKKKIGKKIPEIREIQIAHWYINTFEVFISLTNYQIQRVTGLTTNLINNIHLYVEFNCNFNKKLVINIWWFFGLSINGINSITGIIIH